MGSAVLQEGGSLGWGGVRLGEASCVAVSPGRVLAGGAGAGSGASTPACSAPAQRLPLVTLGAAWGQAMRGNLRGPMCPSVAQGFGEPARSPDSVF